MSMRLVDSKLVEYTRVEMVVSVKPAGGDAGSSQPLNQILTLVIRGDGSRKHTNRVLVYRTICLRATAQQTGSVPGLHKPR